MATSTKDIISAPETIGSSSLPVKTLSYRWIIHNAPAFLNGKYIDPNGFKSPTFEVILPGTETISKWQLVISGRDKPSLLSTSMDVDYSLLLQPSNEIDIGAKILISDCTFSIINSNTNEVKHCITAATKTIVIGSSHHEVKHCITAATVIGTSHIHGYRTPANTDEIIGINHFIKQADLTKYLDGHTLTLQVVATLSFLTNYYECVETHNTLVPADNIRKDLGSFCQDDLFADVTITCDGKEFRAHKVILASQSPVFKKMFEIDMKERRSGVIEVSDITPAVMSDLLASLYTGTAPNVGTLARELLNAADKYELPRLLSICETTLVSKITVRSVLEILILAELHQAKTLKKACLGFIKCNFARISELDSWMDMKASASHQKLVFEVLESSQQAYSIPSMPKKQRM